LIKLGVKTEKNKKDYLSGVRERNRDAFNSNGENFFVKKIRDRQEEKLQLSKRKNKNLGNNGLGGG
jgi:hypothetical protein